MLANPDWAQANTMGGKCLELFEDFEHGIQHMPTLLVITGTLPSYKLNTAC